MKTYIIQLPEGKYPPEPGKCPNGCPFHDTFDGQGDEFCAPHNCPLSEVREAVEVGGGDINRIAPDDMMAFGNPVTLYAVKKEGK